VWNEAVSDSEGLKRYSTQKNEISCYEELFMAHSTDDHGEKSILVQEMILLLSMRFSGVRNSVEYMNPHLGDEKGRISESEFVFLARLIGF